MKKQIQTPLGKYCKLNVSHVMRKPYFVYVNNKGTEQPLHSRSQISTIVVRCQDSIMPILAMSKISRLKLASVAESHLVRNSEDRFSRDMAHVFFDLLLVQ